MIIVDLLLTTGLNMIGDNRLNKNMSIKSSDQNPKKLKMPEGKDLDWNHLILGMRLAHLFR